MWLLSISRPFLPAIKFPDTLLLCRRYLHQVVFYANSYEAVKDIPNGATLLVGGFGLCGTPEILIHGLLKTGVKNLTIISNNCGANGCGLGLLLQSRQIKRMISSAIGENTQFAKQYLRGEVEVEFVPQGTLAERIRAGGAGIPAFFTPAGVGTMIQSGGIPIKYSSDGTVLLASQPKEERVCQDGKPYLLEKSITGDFALIKAWKADRLGNLIFHKSARNFNPAMCRASKVTIAQVDEIVDIGDLDPENVTIPHIYVHRIVKAESHAKPVVKMQEETVSPIRERIIRRVALELKDGMFVNLGIGLPMLVPSYFVKTDANVTFQCENGIFGMGPFPLKNEDVDLDLINAAKQPVTTVKGASFLSSEDTFAMIRGGHIDMTILGAMQVSQFGDLANWILPGKLVKGMGGAMDLACCGSKVVVAMEHTTKQRTGKIVAQCSLPLTGNKVVSLLVTEMGVFKVSPQTGLTLIEIAENVALCQIRAATDCEFNVSHSLKPMGQLI